MNERLADISERISSGVSVAREMVPMVLSDPREYPREAMLLALVTALALVFVVTLALVVFEGISNRIRMRSTGLRVRRRFAGSRVLVVLAVVAVLGLAIAIAPRFALPSRTCGVCHATRAATDAWRQSTHADTGCYGCHATPGPLGAIEATWRGLGARVTRSRAGATTTDSRTCLTCHEDIATEVVGQTVRVSHAEIIEGGLTCVSCHPGVGHGDPEEADPIEREVMSRCLTCHDDQTAPAECSTCHPSNPSDTAQAPAGTANRIVPTCEGGCHSEELSGRCVACHGLKLPHPAGFLRTHAPLSAQDPGLCARCHESASPSQSCACHPDGQTHGSYSEWFPAHGPQAQASGPGGCLCHDDGGYAQCLMCHDTSPW